jgi:hypothetical protein
MPKCKVATLLHLEFQFIDVGEIISFTDLINITSGILLKFRSKWQLQS